MENDTLLFELNKELLPYLSPAMCFAVLLSVSGAVGNSLVLLYYGRQRQTDASEFFMAVLACYGVVVSFIVLPSNMYALAHHLVYNNRILCKVYMFAEMFTTIGSALTYMIIAMDLYVKVNNPFYRLSKKIAKALCVTTGAITLALETPFAFLLFGITRPKTRIEKVHGYKCLFENTDKESSLPKTYMMIHNVVFSVVFVTIAFIYCRIWYFIRERKRKRNVGETIEPGLRVRLQRMSSNKKSSASTSVSQYKPDNYADLQSRPDPKPVLELNPKPDLNPDPKPDLKTDTMPDLNPDPKPDLNPDPKTDLKPKPEPELKSEVKPEPNRKPGSENAHSLISRSFSSPSPSTSLNSLETLSDAMLGINRHGRMKIEETIRDTQFNGNTNNPVSSSSMNVINDNTAVKVETDSAFVETAECESIRGELRNKADLDTTKQHTEPEEAIVINLEHTPTESDLPKSKPESGPKVSLPPSFSPDTDRLSRQSKERLQKPHSHFVLQVPETTELALPRHPTTGMPSSSKDYNLTQTIFFFVVTVVFFISYFGAFLFKLTPKHPKTYFPVWIGFKQFVYRMIFIQSVANPLVYARFRPRFKDFVVRFFRKVVAGVCCRRTLGSK